MLSIAAFLAMVQLAPSGAAAADSIARHERHAPHLAALEQRPSASVASKRDQ